MHNKKVFLLKKNNGNMGSKILLLSLKVFFYSLVKIISFNKN